MSEERTPSRSGEAFGFQDAPQVGTQSDPLADEFTPQEAPATPPQEAEPQQVAPEAPAPESAPTPPEGGTEEQTEEERRYAGRYNSVEDLEAGYKNIQRLHSRTAEQLRAAELREQQLRAAIEQVQQRQAQQGYPSQPAEELTDPQQVQRIIDQRVAQQAQQVEQRMTAQQIDQAIASFREQHPDVRPGTPVDETMAQIILEFQRNPETGGFEHSNYPVTVENLELAHQLAGEPQVYEMMLELDLKPNRENVAIAKEALANPALAEELIAQPELLDSDAGLNVARKRAALPQVVNTAVQQTQDGQPTPEGMRKQAYVETGGAGAPAAGAPGARPQGDEFDEALALHRQTRERSVFGV